MLIISGVLSQRALTANKAKFPGLTGLLKMRESSSSCLKSIFFFFMPFHPECPCAHKSCYIPTINGSQVKMAAEACVWVRGGWVREENIACLLQEAAVFHIKLLSLIQHLSWWRIHRATHTCAVVVALQLQVLTQGHSGPIIKLN